MIESLLVALGVVTLGGSASVGWIAGKKRGASAVGAIAEERLAGVAAQRDAADRRAREAQVESARWRAISLAGQSLSAAPVYLDRLSARDAEELARLLRGLVLIDDVVLAGSTGLSLTREDNRASADLAALAPYVLGASRRMSLAVAEMSFETSGAEHVVARPLSGRAEGVLLLVRTTSQRANPLALDAVAHAAARTSDGLAAPSASAPASLGSTDRVAASDSHLAQAFPLLERELGKDVRGVVLAADGLPMFSAANDGPSPATRSAVTAELSALSQRATQTLRAMGIARMEVLLRGGDAITWSPLGPRSRLSVVTFGRADARSGPRLDRLVGALRRVVGAGDRVVSTSAASGGAP